jgi:hypothetical protein
MKNLSLHLMGGQLTRSQMRAVNGGRTYNGGCAYQGGNGFYGIADANSSLSDVQWGASITGGRYCCDSCCTASWLNQDMAEELGC